MFREQRERRAQRGYEPGDEENTMIKSMRLQNTEKTPALVFNGNYEWIFSNTFGVVNEGILLLLVRDIFFLEIADVGAYRRGFVCGENVLSKGGWRSIQHICNNNQM